MKAKEIIASVLGALAVLTGVTAYFLPPTFWQPLCINVSTTLLAGALGILIVNLFLERKDRKRAVRSLLRMILPTIQEANNSMYDEELKQFGKDEFQGLVKRYKDSGGDPRTLTPAEREKLFQMFKSNEPLFKRLIGKIEEDMKELTAILGWSFDPTILREIFDCRFAAKKIALLKLDDSNQAILDTTEHYLDVHIKAYSIFELMKDMAR